MKKLFLILIISLFSIIKSYAIDKNIPKTEEEWDKAYASLAWDMDLWFMIFKKQVPK